MTSSDRQRSGRCEEQQCADVSTNCSVDFCLFHSTGGSVWHTENVSSPFVWLKCNLLNFSIHGHTSCFTTDWLWFTRRVSVWRRRTEMSLQRPSVCLYGPKVILWTSAKNKESLRLSKKTSPDSSSLTALGMTLISKNWTGIIGPVCQSNLFNFPTGRVFFSHRFTAFSHFFIFIYDFLLETRLIPFPPKIKNHRILITNQHLKGKKLFSNYTWANQGTQRFVLNWI